MTPSHAADMVRSFEEGRNTFKKGDYKAAVEHYAEVTTENPGCMEAWNNLGVALCELFQLRRALEAYDRIPESRRTSKTWYNIALAQYYSADHDDALKSIQRCLDLTPSHAAAFDLRGKSQLEQEDYEGAMRSFNQAFTAAGEPRFLLWEAYALHLGSEFTRDLNEQAHKRLLTLLIRRLERLEKFSKRTGEEEVQQQALYFLGCCYSRYGDPLSAIDKLNECLRTNVESETSRAARELLEQTWNYRLRPPWWKWWLQSPSRLNRSLKRVIFTCVFVLLLLIIALFLLHPFIRGLNPRPGMQPDWGVYLFVAGLLLVILVSPSVDQIKTKELEIKMHAPPPLSPLPSPARLEPRIGSMSNGGNEPPDALL